MNKLGQVYESPEAAVTAPSFWTLTVSICDRNFIQLHNSNEKRFGRRTKKSLIRLRYEPDIHCVSTYFTVSSDSGQLKIILIIQETVACLGWPML